MKGFKITFLVIVLVGVFVGVIGISRLKEKREVACTAEAKQCPDGSYVARTGPHCEFAACPTDGEMALWNTYRDEKEHISFRYPKDLTTTYIHTQEWPPIVTFQEGTFTCDENVNRENSSMPMREKKVIDGVRSYCKETFNEGAAGTMYSNYTYTTAYNDKIVALHFVIRYPQCLNYDDPQKSACQAEQGGFDLDRLVDRIVRSMESII